MPLSNYLRPSRSASLALALVITGGVAVPAWAALSNVSRVVLQKGRHYDPGDLFMRRGDSLVLVNGDDTSVHHAFIEADRFAFDGGDQEPGTDRVLKLSQPGDFIIRCGIHPKMRLTVHVQ